MLQPPQGLTCVPLLPLSHRLASMRMKILPPTKSPGPNSCTVFPPFLVELVSCPSSTTQARGESALQGWLVAHHAALGIPATNPRPSNLSLPNPRPTVPHDGPKRPLIHDDIAGVKGPLSHSADAGFLALVGEHVKHIETLQRLARQWSGWRGFSHGCVSE
jgi:hypothetical protein